MQNINQWVNWGVAKMSSFYFFTKTDKVLA